MSPVLVDAGAQARLGQRTLTTAAYIVLLIVLPVYGFWQAILPAAPATLLTVQISMLVGLLVLVQFWQPARPVRGFVLIALLVSVVTGWLIPFISGTSWWSARFSMENPSFWQANSGGLLLKLGATSTMVAALLLIGLHPRDFYLVKGQLDAPLRPVRWLRLRAPRPWTQVGRNFAILSFVVILSATLLPNLSQWGLGSIVRALPLLPAALLFAAVNSVYEEVVFRAALLSQLVGVVGAGHALAISILFFGLGHLSGSIPSGIVGVLLAAFFALIMGKAMLETKGITWPWICHFAADAAVFMFLAVFAAAGTI